MNVLPKLLVAIGEHDKINPPNKYPQANATKVLAAPLRAERRWMVSLL